MLHIAEYTFGTNNLYSVAVHQLFHWLLTWINLFTSRLTEHAQSLCVNSFSINWILFPTFCCRHSQNSMMNNRVYIDVCKFIFLTKGNLRSTHIYTLFVCMYGSVCMKYFYLVSFYIFEYLPMHSMEMHYTLRCITIQWQQRLSILNILTNCFSHCGAFVHALHVGVRPGRMHWHVVQRTVGSAGRAVWSRSTME